MPPRKSPSPHHQTSHFDIAIVKFQKPKEFIAALQQAKMALKPLTLTTASPRMGEGVVAMGFPLGQDLPKISGGVIAGNQEVDGNICIQSTAPISPGNFEKADQRSTNWGTSGDQTG